MQLFNFTIYLHQATIPTHTDFFICSWIVGGCCCCCCSDRGISEAEEAANLEYNNVK